MLVLAFSLVDPRVLIAAGLVIAIIIIVAAVWLFRSGGKKKAQATGAANDWQRAQQGAPGWSQQNPQAGGWGQQAQAQQPGWGQQAGAGGWGGAADATQAAGDWNPQSPQSSPGWGQQAQAQQPGWGAQGASPQPSAGQWGTGTQRVDPPAASSPWGAQAASPQPGQNGGQWGAQGAAQQAQPGWNSGAISPGAAQAASSPNPWGAQQGQAAQAPWEAAQPQEAQAPWAAPQAAPSAPQSAPWGAQSQPGQQAPTGYGGGGSGPSWGQPGGQAAAEPWGASSPAASSWQQPGGPASGNLRPGAGQDATMFGGNEGDKTIVRPGGAPGSLGTVRVEEGKEPGRVYEVRKDSLSIGRSRESDIFLEDLAVSRLHASIVNIGNGSYALKDEGSANGTKVNGQLVSKYQTFPLQEGDRIQLGQTVLVFARR